MKAESYLAVTPRYEHKWFEFFRPGFPDEPLPFPGDWYSRTCGATLDWDGSHNRAFKYWKPQSF